MLHLLGKCTFRHIHLTSKKKRTPCKKKKQFVLSKPKQITRGGHGIRQYMKVDETKLLAEECFGKKIKL